MRECGAVSLLQVADGSAVAFTDKEKIRIFIRQH